ncbi:MAG: hypothetical protein B0W54_10625 [Cellvibrio sp. 79]|nr:MAG: hypothetical protein B0W54_10625 [Cellvibrio sp. 79]
MIVLLDRDFSPEHLANPETIDLRNITKKTWPIVIEKCRAINTRLYNIKLETLEGIQHLKSTQQLTLEWATKISDLSPIFEMYQLTHLNISDFPKAPSICGISKLTNIEQLTLGGSSTLGKPLHLVTIEELAKLPNLNTLYIFNTKLENDDISILAECKNLKKLTISNQFEKKQYAYLAKKLNIQLQTPIVAAKQASSTCGKCGQKKYMLTGRKMPFLCSDCDKKKFEKLTNDFHEMIDKA